MRPHASESEPTGQDVDRITDLTEQIQSTGTVVDAHGSARAAFPVSYEREGQLADQGSVTWQDRALVQGVLGWHQGLACGLQRHASGTVSGGSE